MAYLFILVALALALAPIMALKPSKSQKLQIRLRDKAREQSLQVQVCDMPQTHRQAVRKEDPEKGVAYRFLWRHPDARFCQFDYRLHRLETEPNRAPPSVLAELRHSLEQLPATVTVIEFNNIGVAVYWQEAGDENVVAQIARELRALSTRLETIALLSRSAV